MNILMILFCVLFIKSIKYQEICKRDNRYSDFGEIVKIFTEMRKEVQNEERKMYKHEGNLGKVYKMCRYGKKEETINNKILKIQEICKMSKDWTSILEKFEKNNIPTIIDVDFLNRGNERVGVLRVHNLENQDECREKSTENVRLKMKKRDFLKMCENVSKRFSKLMEGKFKKMKNVEMDGCDFELLMKIDQKMKKISVKKGKEVIKNIGLSYISQIKRRSCSDLTLQDQATEFCKVIKSRINPTTISEMRTMIRNVRSFFKNEYKNEQTDDKNIHKSRKMVQNLIDTLKFSVGECIDEEMNHEISESGVCKRVVKSVDVVENLFNCEEKMMRSATERNPNNQQNSLLTTISPYYDQVRHKIVIPISIIQFSKRYSPKKCDIKCKQMIFLLMHELTHVTQIGISGKKDEIDADKHGIDLSVKYIQKYIIDRSSQNDDILKNVLSLWCNDISKDDGHLVGGERIKKMLESYNENRRDLLKI